MRAVGLSVDRMLQRTFGSVTIHIFKVVLYVDHQQWIVGQYWKHELIGRPRNGLSDRKTVENNINNGNLTSIYGKPMARVSTSLRVQKALANSHVFQFRLSKGYFYTCQAYSFMKTHSHYHTQSHICSDLKVI